MLMASNTLLILIMFVYIIMYSKSSKLNSENAY